MNLKLERHKKEEPGRSKSEKKIKIVLAVEYRNGECGRGYAKIIEDYSNKSLSPLFEEHIKNDAHILADGWSGDKPFKENYKIGIIDKKEALF